jgi:4-hydroxy-3-methylbut-2-enyl diphosphate reductase
MEVISIEPHGFCEGVVSALLKAKQARKEHPIGPIYVLGLLVHNEDVIGRLEKEGFLFCDEQTKSLEEWIAEIPERSVVVFAAHGHAPRLDRMAEDRHLITYDATCHFVKDNAFVISRETQIGNDVIYIGRKKHAEAIATLGIDSARVHLFDSEHPEDDSWQSIESSSPLVLAQTTMDLDDIASAQESIRRIYPSARFQAERCSATQRRQTAILTAPEDIDVYIILGSSRSNNTLKLEAVAKKAYPKVPVLRVLDLADLQSHDLTGKKKAALASGASTSPQVFSEVEAYLKDSLNHFRKFLVIDG